MEQSVTELGFGQKPVGTSGAEFIFGRQLGGARGPVGWDPDSEAIGNPHIILSGESGSGKSYLLRDIVKWLALPTSARNGKHIYIIDLHGDLKIPGIEENHIEFTGRNSPHGINPFEFDKDERNGGSAVQVEMIVTMVKKAFLPKMGARQEALLRQLLLDCYQLKGIDDNDISTWDNELPSMETLLNLIRQVINYQKNSGGRIAGMLQKMDTIRRGIEKDDQAGYFRKALEEVGVSNLENIVNERRMHIIDTKNRLDGERGTVAKSLVERRREIDDPVQEANDEKIMGLEKQLARIDEELAEMPKTDYIIDYVVEDIISKADIKSAHLHGSTTAKKIISKIKSLYRIRDEVDALMMRYTAYCSTGAYGEMFGAELPEEIDPSVYASNASLPSLEGLELYIGAAASSGIFSDKKPPIKEGLNRLDISGLSPQLQSFFVDTFVNRIFLSMKRRGEYKGGARGARCDTYIVIDEGASILPSGRELNSNKFILNKWFQEMRKFGAAICFVSQSPSHYSSPILSAYTKVVLKLQPDVIPAARKCLGIKDSRLFEVVETARTALVERGQGFTPVALSGYKGNMSQPGHNSNQDDVGRKGFSLRRNVG